MKKRLIFISAALSSFFMSIPVWAETASETAGGDSVNLLNVLTSVGYVAVVLALIYIILICIDKYAKRSSKNNPTENQTEDAAKNITEQPEIQSEDSSTAPSNDNTEK